MSKIAIVGDLHFGVRSNSAKYLEFQLRWMREELFPYLKKNKSVKHLIQLGDFFDNRTSLSPYILKHARDVVNELVNLRDDLTIHALIGNHDLYYKDTREIHSLNVLKDNGCKVYEDITELEIEGRKLLILPWITKHDIDDCQVLLSKNKFDLCFGHLEINGFQLTKGIVETNGLSTDLFSNCTRVYSGHFHLRSENKNIQYVGTPYELDFGDMDSVKGFDVVDLKTMESKFVESKKIPRHKKISSEVIPFDKLRSEIITNNFLQVRFSSTITEVEKIKYIERLNSLEPISASFEDEGSVVDNSELELESNIKDTLGFLKEYIEVIELPENVDQKKLLEKVKEVFQKVS